MTEINQDRKELNRALKDKSLTLLVLSGSDNNTWAPEIHAHAEQIQDPWCRTFWIRDLGVLTQEELDTWFAKGGRYAVLCGGKDENGKKVWIVTVREDLTALLTPAEKPSTKAILDAFATCKS